MPYEPLVDCPKCHGVGFLHPRYPDGRVNFRIVSPCDYPGCLKDDVLRYKQGDYAAGSGVLQPVQTFDTFDTKVPGVAKAYKMAYDIAEGMGDYIWLIIYGNPGCGKTHLLNAIANRVIERGFGARYVLMADLLSELRMAIKTNETDEKLQELKRVPYLLIDEVGLEYGSDWEKQKVDELLTARWANGRFTIAATNLDIEQLPDRIRSRFKDKHLSRYVKNEAADYRVSHGSAKRGK